VEHWNIQVNIQHVTEPVMKHVGNGVARETERKVVDMLKLAVTADSAEQAIAKAIRFIEASAD
jgi:hypothetical protein